MAKLIIDISEYQTKVDASKLNADGVILRLGFTGYGSLKPALDKKFEEYYKAYHDAGVPVGIYYFTLAYTDAMVDMETDWVLEMIKDKHLELPVWIDVEGQTHCAGWTNLGKAERSRLVAKWCEKIQKAGYYTGIYANLDWLKNKLDANVIAPYDKWVAQYYSKCTYNKSYGMWQYTSSECASAHGITSGSNRVDASWAYIDYPTVIKNAKLNHLDEKPVKPVYDIYAFRSDVRTILRVTNNEDAFKKTVTISTVWNKHNALVTPLERYMSALGYYIGEIEADKGKKPVFGKLMDAAVKGFQREVIKPTNPKHIDGELTKGGDTWKKLLLG
jgi:GH25 family lysozyme M1 (1,4-beta-N-acetylmuramidase)